MPRPCVRTWTFSQSKRNDLVVARTRTPSSLAWYRMLSLYTMTSSVVSQYSPNSGPSSLCLHPRDRLHKSCYKKMKSTAFTWEDMLVLTIEHLVQKWVCLGVVGDAVCRLSEMLGDFFRRVIDTLLHPTNAASIGPLEGTSTVTIKSSWASHVWHKQEPGHGAIWFRRTLWVSVYVEKNSRTTVLLG